MLAFLIAGLKCIIIADWNTFSILIMYWNIEDQFEAKKELCYPEQCTKANL